MDDSGQPAKADAAREQPGGDRLHAILDRVVAFVGALTPEGIMTEANEPALEAAGLQRTDVIGRPFWDTYWWNYDPQVQARLRDAIARAAKGETVRYEEEIRVARDRRLIIDFQLAPHLCPEGKVAELITSGIDISRHKQNERAVQAARDSFEQMVTQSPFGVFCVDADFRISLLAQGARKTFATTEPTIGRDLAEALRIIWPEPFATEAIGRFRHTLETGEPYHAPSTVERRKDLGVVESYDWKTERLVLPDGRYGVICHFYDLSEREQYEAALRASEARFRATFENAAVGIAHTARDGRWLLVNQKLCQIVGYSAEEIEHLTFPDITYEDDIEISRQRHGQLAAGEIDDFQLEKRYVRKDGSLVWVKKTVAAVRKEDGSLDYFIAVIEDIMEQKAAQEQEKLLVSELNHRIKNTLATIQAMASHTLRNAASPEDFRDSFSGRLRAIAAAHDAIFQNGGRASLNRLIRAQMAGYGADDEERLEISGTGTVLSANSAHGLGLILHELATNAAKYGALSSEAGRIMIDIEEPEEGRVRLRWIESGGPSVSPPDREGFGSKLIRSTLEGAMQGEAQLDYRPEGVEVTLTFAKGM